MTNLKASVVTHQNELGENFYQPSMSNGMRLFNKDSLLNTGDYPPGWYDPHSIAVDSFSPDAYLTVKDIEFLHGYYSERTFSQILQPKLYKSERKALRTAEKAIIRAMKNLRTRKANTLHEVERLS